MKKSVIKDLMNNPFRTFYISRIRWYNTLEKSVSWFYCIQKPSQYSNVHMSLRYIRRLQIIYLIYIRSLTIRLLISVIIQDYEYIIVYIYISNRVAISLKTHNYFSNCIYEFHNKPKDYFITTYLVAVYAMLFGYRIRYSSNSNSETQTVQFLQFCLLGLDVVIQTSPFHLSVQLLLITFAE